MVERRPRLGLLHQSIVMGYDKLCVHCLVACENQVSFKLHFMCLMLVTSLPATEHYPLGRTATIFVRPTVPACARSSQLALSTVGIPSRRRGREGHWIFICGSICGPPIQLNAILL